MEDQADVMEQPAEEDEIAEAYALDRKAVASILYAVEIEDQARLTELMEPLHAADIADLLEQISDCLLYTSDAADE